MILTIIRHVAEMFAHSGDVLSQRSINSSRCCGTSVLLCRNSNISSMLLWYLQPQTLYGIWNTTTRLLPEKQRLNSNLGERILEACLFLSVIHTVKLFTSLQLRILFCISGGYTVGVIYKYCSSNH